VDGPHDVLNSAFLAQIDEGVPAVLEDAELVAEAEINRTAAELFSRKFGRNTYFAGF